MTARESFMKEVKELGCEEEAILQYEEKLRRVGMEMKRRGRKTDKMVRYYFYCKWAGQLRASCFNLPYSDGGLFGLFAVANANQMDGVLKGMMKEFAAVTKGNIAPQDFDRAKNQFKASMLMNVENQDSLFEDLAVQALNTGGYTSPADVAQQIDSITADDALKVAKKVFNGKPCMAASGNLGQTPYLDQLI